LENLAAPQRKFEAMWRPEQKVILKHGPGALQRTAHRGLAQQKPGCCCRDALLLRNGSKRNQEVQVDLA
jgi:hypothetical protein